MHVTDFTFCICFVFIFLQILHHPNLLFSLVNMSNILFYTIFTHVCDLEVKVMDLDIFIYGFVRFCDLILSKSCVGFGLYLLRV